MAQSSFPFEGIDTTETQFSQMFRHLQDGVNGTYGGTELTVGAGTGLAVDVEAGQAMVRGHYYVSTAVESLALATADPTNPRLDIVVLRLDPVANSIVLAVKAGTPAGSPVAPSLVQTDAGIYEMGLATVLVPATAGVPSTITDLREFMGTRISMWTDDTRPTTAVPHVGYNVTQETFEGYDVIAAEWGPIGGGGGGVTVADTPPADPEAGALWWDSANGELYVYYVDVDSSQWVAAAGPSVTVQSTAPTGYEGQLWLDDTDGSMYVYYTDPGGGASSWIGAVSRSGGILQVVSTTKTDSFSAGTSTFAEVTGLSASITPNSTSSKIYIMVTGTAGHTSTSRPGYTTIAKDGSPIYIGDQYSTFTNWVRAGSAMSVSSDNFGDQIAMSYLDSPATTSSITYSVQARVGDGSGAMTIGRTGGAGNDANRFTAPSTITLIEVAG